jgi:hypothetical protein
MVRQAGWEMDNGAVEGGRVVWTVYDAVRGSVFVDV